MPRTHKDINAKEFPKDIPHNNKHLLPNNEEQILEQEVNLDKGILLDKEMRRDKGMLQDKGMLRDREIFQDKEVLRDKETSKRDTECKPTNRFHLIYDSLTEGNPLLRKVEYLLE
jgi:hypothetical protein